MAVRTFKLPKIKSDGICHAILEDGTTRCPNKTFIKPNGEYSKWCQKHTTECSRLNSQYKNSCANFDYLECNRSDTYKGASTKLFALNSCYKDRVTFENKCLYEGRRDEGHKQFMKTLQSRKSNCEDAVERLRPRPQSQTTMIKSLSEDEKLIQAMDNLLVSIVDINLSPSFYKSTTPELKKLEQPKKSEEPVRKKTTKSKKEEEKIPKKDEFMDFILPKTSSSLLLKETIEEPVIEGLIYQMTDKEKKEYKQKISKTIKSIPDVKQRLKKELILITLESKSRSYPNFKKTIDSYILSSRNTIYNMIESILANDLTADELKHFNDLVQKFSQSINNLEKLLNMSENNFTSEKFDEILREYIESMKVASHFVTNVNKLIQMMSPEK